MLINSTHRLRIPNPLKPFFIFLFLYFSTALFAQTFTAQTLQSAKIAVPEIVSKADTFCGKAFFKRLFIQGQSTAGYQIVPASNGNFFLTAAVGEKTMIALADRKMEILWAKSVDMGLGAEFVLDMRLDSEGNIIGVGNTSLLPVECFAFKMNPTDGQLIWLSKLNDPGNSYFTRILEKNSGANYLLFGQTDLVGTGNNSGCDALLMEINRTTGELLWDRQYDLGSCEIVNDVFIENNHIYTCGRYNLVNGGQSRFRGAMTLFDTTGDVQWSRHYLVGNNQDARLYFSALTHENDGLVAFGYGDDGGVSLTATTLQLVKTDSAGVAIWAKKYDIVGGNEERATKLFSLPDGYLLFGTFFSPTASREICLLKTDKQGDLLWGKSYGALGEDRLSDAILVADSIYLIGSRQNAQIFDMLIGKLDLNGEVDSQCDFVKNLDVTVSDYAAPLDFSHNLEELDITHNYATAALPPQAGENVTTEVICQKICAPPCDTVKLSQIVEFCPGDSVPIGGVFYTQPGTVVKTISGVGGDCDTIVTYALMLDISFLKVLGRDNSDEAALGVYDAKDGNLYVSGAVGGDSLAIIKMTPAGDIIWSDRINFLNGQKEYISELIVDDEGMIVGSGTMDDGVYSTGFLFRYDPAAHALIWVKRITFQCQLLGILQKPNTGNYRIYLSFINPQVTTNTIVKWDINKMTGTSILGTANRYAVDTADVIRNMVLDGDKIYAVGGYTFQGFGVGGRRHALTRFDLNGNVEWSRLGPADQSAVQRLIGNDLIIDNQHIISVYSGDDDGTSMDSTTIFLQKNTLDGDLVWVRKFDLGAGFYNEIVEEVVAVADGYVLMGRNQSGPGDLFFLKTDKEGHLVWAKKLDIADDNFAYLGRDQSQLLAFDNGLYFAAKTQDAAGQSDMVIGRMNLKGEIGVDCDFIQPLQVTEIAVGNPLNIPVNLLKLSHGATNSDLTVPPVPVPTTLAVKNICAGCETPGCDTVYLAQTIEFCPGDLVQIGGEEYSQPGTVLDTVFGSGTDCDTIVTYTLQFYQNSIVQMQCPANLTVEAASGTNSAIVNYDIPTANTDCICSGATVELLQGQPSGSDFPVGTTQVCYEAEDDCGGSNSCCFIVTVQAAPPEDACDVKQTSCVKFEILGIFQNPAKQRTYRMRVTNSCANKLVYTTFQLPDGVVADAPATNTTYTAPSGRQYEVRNPNFSPAYSIRFKAIGDGIANGQSDVFEYTLPPQSEPLFIHATAKLFPQVFVETHLNTFNCPVQQTSNRPAETKERQGTSIMPKSAMTIFPNPASDVLHLRLSNWESQQIQIRVTDAYGRSMFEQTSNSDSNLLKLELPTYWPTGIYYLEAVNEKGDRQSGRFVRAAQR